MKRDHHNVLESVAGWMKQIATQFGCHRGSTINPEPGVAPERTRPPDVRRGFSGSTLGRSGLWWLCGAGLLTGGIGHVSLTPALHAGLAPELRVEVQELDFGLVTYGSQTRQYLSVGNLGGGDLRVHRISFPADEHGQYSLDFASMPVIVRPGESHQVVVRLTPHPDGSPVTAMEIETDDPQNPRVSVPLYHRVRFYIYIVAVEGQALTNGSTIRRLEWAPSINDDGDVAVAAVMDDDRHTILGLEQGVLRDRLAMAPFLYPASGHRFDLRHAFRFGPAVQINNAGQITWLATSKDGLFAFVVRQDRHPLALRTVAHNHYPRLDGGISALPGPFDFAFPYPSRALSPWVTINNTGRVLFSGVLKADVTKTVLATPRDMASPWRDRLDDFFRSGWLTGFPDLVPMIADTDRTVVRMGGRSDSPIVDFTDARLANAASRLIAGLPEFEQLGKMPGISDDGRVIAFAARNSSEGIGIYLAVGDRQMDVGKVIGVSDDGHLDPGEIWQDRNGNGQVDPGEDRGVVKQLVLDARIAVNRSSDPGVDRYGLVFLAYGRDVTGDGRHPLGLYQANAVIHEDRPPTIFGPTLVVQVGDTLPDRKDTVKSLAIWDPLNVHGQLVFSADLE